MSNLKARWATAETPVKVAVALAAVIVGVIFVLKILPVLLAAMGVGALLAILFVPYWIPTILALVRKHPSRGGIFAINLLLGWTFIGWVAALAWSLSDASGRAPQSVVVHTTVSPSFSVGSPTFTPASAPSDVNNGMAPASLERLV